MKSHTYLGARLFKNIQSDFDEIALQVALNHHEKWNGTGYPGHIDPETEEPLPGFEGANGNFLSKKEEEIPLFGRIVAVLLGLIGIIFTGMMVAAAIRAVGESMEGYKKSKNSD